MIYISRYYITTIILFGCVTALFSQEYKQGIDTVYSFKPGKGQNDGQDTAYYPKNIFGLPAKTATEYIPASSPADVLSIGLGGEIVVGFKDYLLFDDDGPDFTIFENAFINPATGKMFAEPAKIAVSQDGVNFIEFPFDSLTLTGCAGTKPTNGADDPFNPSESGGNSFDLKDVGLQYISQIKITDICEMILNNPKHPFYDPIISGFDLDAVVSWHLKPRNLDVKESNFDYDMSAFYSSGNLIVKSKNFNSTNRVKIFNVLGNLLITDTFYTEKIINLNEFPSGIYFVEISTGFNRIVKKLIK